jgi:hypothetical protein
MLWVEVKAALVSVVQSIALRQADAGWRVEWLRGRRAFISPKTRAGVYLRVPMSRLVGLDEERIVPAAGLSTQRHGQREFVLEVQVVSYAPPDTATDTRAAFVDDALEFAERIRTRIQRQAARQALDAVNVSIVSFGDTRETELVVDSRVQQVVTLEIFMRAGWADEVETDLDYFDHTELTSEVSDGVSDLPAGGQLAAEQVGPVDP